MNRALICLLLTGCATTPQPAPEVQYKPQVVDTACSWDKPIIVAKDEAPKLSDDLSGQILAHDREWKKQCAAPRE